jgi:hypothetical protein
MIVGDSICASVFGEGTAVLNNKIWMQPEMGVYGRYGSQLKLLGRLRRCLLARG